MDGASSPAEGPEAVFPVLVGLTAGLKRIRVEGIHDGVFQENGQG
jgi:hypothetical protein